MNFIPFDKNTLKDSIDNKALKSEFNDLAIGIIDSNPSLEYLFRCFKGCSFEKGLFRIHNIGSSFYWTKLVNQYFPKYQNIYCFGFDWVGRQYAIDIKDANIIYMFDSATGEDFELEQNLEGFFNEDLVEDIEDTLAINDFIKTKNELGIKSLKYDECIGFKTPLFLGGEDIIENYEVMDLDVFWDLNYQLYNKINKLSGGSIIDEITFK